MIVPYYDENAIQDSKTVEVPVRVFTNTISTSKEAVVPECGKEVIVSFAALECLQVGSYLWSGAFGWFEVTQIVNDLVFIKNLCSTVNAVAGTVMPACTLFDISTPRAL